MIIASVKSVQKTKIMKNLSDIWYLNEESIEKMDSSKIRKICGLNFVSVSDFRNIVMYTCQFLDDYAYDLTDFTDEEDLVSTMKYLRQDATDFVKDYLKFSIDWSITNKVLFVNKYANICKKIIEQKLILFFE